MGTHLKAGLIVSLKTLGLVCLGTSTIVGSHHLGRKQYNPDARLRDYVDGVIKKFSPVESSQHFPHASTFSETTATDDNLSSKPKLNTSNNLPRWISGVADLKSSTFAVVAINSDRQIIWQTPMPERVHDILIQPVLASNSDAQRLTSKISIHPDVPREFNLATHGSLKNSHSSHVTVMGRRPSETFWVLDTQNGDIIHIINAHLNRHFYGHACYSLDGDLLYVTENNTSTYEGVIGVYDVNENYKKIAEFATHGIGPHELVMHPDGKTLVVANGGIKTEKASREELNLDSMQPSLVYINRQDGRLLQQIYPEHNQMSVRHLTMHDNGTVIIGIQFQGERHLSVPLVLTHKFGDKAFTPLGIDNEDTKGWHRFHHYIASVAVDSDHDLICATSPIGGCAAVFDLQSAQMIEAVELADCAGAAIWSSSSYANKLLQNDSLMQDSIDNQGNNYLSNFKHFTDNDKNNDSSNLKPQFLISDGQGYLSKLTVHSTDNHKSLAVQQLKLPYAFDNHLNCVV